MLIIKIYRHKFNPISLDHKDFLGIPERITHNKCGIIKNNTNVIIAKQTNEVLGYIDEN